MPPVSNSDPILLKIESLRNRAGMLVNLRSILSLKPHQDINKRQWEVLEGQLAAASNRIRHKLRVYADRYIANKTSKDIKPSLANQLGELELEMTDAYVFFDTYMDILTQRLSDDIGMMLRGCDVIAADALNRGFLSDITVPPLVYCERGFGASTLREGVNIRHNLPNPIPFIAIPYARINEKYNLISINHEVGHQAMSKLNMVRLWQQVFEQNLSKAGAGTLICKMFCNWSREIIPDFWAFCLSGMAQTMSLKEILSLPASSMFSISPGQVHPPSYIRFLISVEWCRQLWGKGDWDDWENEWKLNYPLEKLDEPTRAIIVEAVRWVPDIGKLVLHTKFKKLDHKPLSSLFSLKDIEPHFMKKLAQIECVSSTEFKRMPVSVQLGIFRLIREKRQYKFEEQDQVMNTWLRDLKN